MIPYHHDEFASIFCFSPVEYCPAHHAATMAGLAGLASPTCIGLLCDRVGKGRMSKGPSDSKADLRFRHVLFLFQFLSHLFLPMSF